MRSLLALVVCLAACDADLPTVPESSAVEHENVYFLVNQQTIDLSIPVDLTVSDPCAYGGEVDLEWPGASTLGELPHAAILEDYQIGCAQEDLAALQAFTGCTMPARATVQMIEGYYFGPDGCDHAWQEIVHVEFAGNGISFQNYAWRFGESLSLDECDAAIAARRPTADVLHDIH